MNGRAATRVSFTVVGDDLRVSAPAGLEALGDFLETEIGTSTSVLGLIEHHVRHDRGWRFTGNACRLRLDGDTVTISHEYTGGTTTLGRAELRSLLADLRALLTEG